MNQSDKIAAEQAARRVAGQWHGGQGSAMYAYASAGTVTAELMAELRAEADGADGADAAALEAVYGWLLAEHGAELAERCAVELGAEHGRTAAAWVDQDDIGAILDGIEDGDPVVLDSLPAPLSGEWADSFTVADLVAEVAGVLLVADDEVRRWCDVDAVADTYDDAYHLAYHAELRRRAAELAG